MIKPIKTEENYDAALKKLHGFIRKGYVEGTPDADEAEVLAILVHAYEQEHYPIPPPHPLEAIKFRLEQMGLDEKDLSKILGSRTQNSEILTGKRKLSLSMIRKLHEVLKIPVETLVMSY